VITFGRLHEGPNGQCERYPGLSAINSWPTSTNAGSQHRGVHSTICRDGKETQKKSSRVCLASNLRAARSLYRWSQEQLGFQCGLKRTDIGALERREVNPGIDNLDKLAIGVGVLAHVLLLSPELAYAEIYGAYSATFDLQPAY
jgi:DNA-binding XRE family transcriptional regulator